MNFGQTRVKLNKYDWLQKDKLTNYQNEFLIFFRFSTSSVNKIDTLFQNKKPMRLPFKNTFFDSLAVNVKFDFIFENRA